MHARATFGHVASQTPRTLAELLSERMELSIIQRGLRPGDRLGSIADWIRSTGYARPTVRESVRIMVERGTIEVRTGRSGGLFVAASDPVLALQRNLRRVYEVGSLKVEDVTVLLRALDPLIGADAARARNDEDIREVSSSLLRLEQADDQQTFEREFRSMHQRIAQITPNSLLKVVVLALSSLLGMDLSEAGSPVVESPQIRDAAVARYRAFVAAIVAGDQSLAASAGADLHAARHEE